MSEVAEKIKSDEAIRILIEKYRTSGDKKVKEGLPHVTFSGVFSTRRADSLERRSGLVSFDFDNVGSVEAVKTALGKDSVMIPVLMFTSPSGNGVKVVYRIAEEWLDDYKKSYRRIATHINGITGEEADTSTSSIVSKCFLSHDPDVYFNESLPFSKVGKIQETHQREAPMIPIVSRSEDLDSVVSLVKQIETRQIDITAKYGDWCSLGFALSNLGEVGRALFHRISKFHPEYDQNECDAKFTELKNNSRGDVRIATFFAICKQHGVYLKANRTELPVGTSPALSNPPNTKSNPKATENKVEAYLKSHFEFRFNIVLSKPEIDAGNGFDVMNDIALNSLHRDVKNAGLKITREQLYQLLCSDFVTMYHPFKDYFDKLPA